MRKYVAFAELPEEERAIGRRVRAARSRARVSQPKLAKAIGLTRDQLSSVELGRVALRFDPAWALCSQLDINPLWLASGEGPMAGFVNLDRSKIYGDALFSEEAAVIRKEVNLQIADTLSRKLEVQQDLIAKLLDSWHVSIPPDDISRFRRFMHRVAAAYPIVRNSLTIPDLLDIVALMKTSAKSSRWQQLQHRLQNATRERGAKSSLARELGIDRQTVSEWLRHAVRGPSAETTLRLLEWVKAAEAKQKKRAGSAETRPALKTRKRKSKYEKPKSSQIKH